LVAAITIAAALLFLLMAVFRMGWISQFLSKVVITGFLFGAAIEVVIGELPKLTGTEIEGSNAWQKLWSWFGSLSESDALTLAVGVVSLLTIFGLRFKAPKERRRGCSSGRSIRSRRTPIRRRTTVPPGGLEVRRRRVVNNSANGAPRTVIVLGNNAIEEANG
jgi:hypothetical protein